jgi:hypothetical protein
LDFGRWDQPIKPVEQSQFVLINKTWCHLHSKFETLESGANSSRDREGNIKVIMQGLDVNSMMQAELTVSLTFYVRGVT